MCYSQISYILFLNHLKKSDFIELSHLTFFLSSFPTKNNWNYNTVAIWVTFHRLRPSTSQLRQYLNF